jgi:RecJ-like exonuclease
MLDKIETLVAKANAAAGAIRPFSGEVRVVSHYDCDGICSGSILAKALMREGKRFRISFVKQLTADVIENLANEENRLTIFADLGSGQLDAIQSKILKGGGMAIVLDHHQPQGEVLTDKLIHVNTFVMGMGENISGSGIAYIAARALNPENKDLSAIGVVGAIGDSQVDAVGSDWGLFGVNKEILKDAQASGKMKVERGLRIWGRTTRPLHKALEYSVDPYIPGVTGSESGAVHFLQELGIELKSGSDWRTLSDLTEDEMKKLASGIIRERVRGNRENPDWVFGDVYTLHGRSQLTDANEFATMLNAAGKKGIAHLGVELCMNSPGALEEVQDVLEGYRREIGRALDLVCRNCNGESGKIVRKSTVMASYIVAGDAISENVISNVTSIMCRSVGMPELPLFSFVDAEGGMTKISARLPDSMTGKLNLKEVVEQAAKGVGGEGGGHSNAAGANIPRGSEEMFINSIETILTNLLVAKEGCEKKVESYGGRGNETEAGEGRSQAGEAQAGSGRQEAARGSSWATGQVEGQGLVRYISA